MGYVCIFVLGVVVLAAFELYASERWRRRFAAAMCRVPVWLVAPAFLVCVSLSAHIATIWAGLALLLGVVNYCAVYAALRWKE